MKSILSFEGFAAFLLFGIITTIPLLFGAVHPIVSACYVFVMLVGLGGWLLFDPEPTTSMVKARPSFWIVVPCFFIVYLLFQSLPLPIALVEILSPQRAERIAMVNTLAGTNHQFITLSDNGFVGLYRSFSYLALLIYYFSLIKLLAKDQKYYVTLLYCLITVGSFEALYGLLQFVNPQIGVLWAQVAGRAAHGTILYKNQYASFLNMIWPLAIALSVIYFSGKDKKRKRRSNPNSKKSFAERISTTKIQVPIFVFAAGSMILALLFSLSRGGILAMVLVVLLMTVLMPFSRKNKLIVFTTFGCLIGGYGAMLGFDTIISRFGSLGQSADTRMSVYLLSLPMLFDHWLTGIGLGSYSLLSPIYLKGFPVDLHFYRAHNEYLETLIEFGIPVGTLLIVWLYAGMYKIISRLFNVLPQTKRDFTRIVVGIAAFCGLAGFLVHGVVDFGWRLPANLVYAVTLLALCNSTSKVAQEQ